MEISADFTINVRIFHTLMNKGTQADYDILVKALQITDQDRLATLLLQNLGK